ncbi:CBS domain-containing protein [Mycobacterium vicinigordonae]|uniref:CBS domain-containing protein n=1 Tax=Mycobacterium vicinigordonae TaxID=1719132 RepID=A0A7D6DVQ5_9MYCO|nr:CBS domain-containing protein [Mycobacterium vicinigordonae]QLL05070.1 CBS domain-containing protein [Mycobacterium vicinigordonae]
MTTSSSAGALPVSSVVGDPVARVAPDATVADAAAAMAAVNVGAILVGEETWPSALLSERDVLRVVADGKNPNAVRAAEVASAKLVWCDADATVDEVATQMMEHYIRHILVERDGELMGIVSARDLLGVYSSDAVLDAD